MNLKPLITTLFLLALLVPLSSAALYYIEYPANGEIIYQTSRIKLNVSSAASYNCKFNYNNIRNQSIACSGVSYVDLPSGNGVYNISVMDNASNVLTGVVFVRKPSGNMVIFTYIFTFLIVAGLVFYFIVLLAKLASYSIGIYDVAINFALYFGLLFCNQLALEYAPVPLFLEWISFFVSNLAWTAIMLPSIGYVVCFFIRLFNKKGDMDVNDYNGRVM